MQSTPDACTTHMRLSGTYRSEYIYDRGVAKVRKLIIILLIIAVCVSQVGYSALCEGYSAYDIGIPNLNGCRYSEGDMNIAVFWVQVQMKASGQWYQGEQWDCTGNLGDHTMHEVASFMESCGYSGHTGFIDQNVVNELANYLGYRVQPVLVGGFYEAMGAIMSGGSIGSMQPIISNLRDMVPRETVGARWVQTCLKHLGYYTSIIDGKYGEETERSVNAFQRDYGFEERDYVSLGVARAMLEAYYYAGGDLNKLPYWTLPHSTATPISRSEWNLTFLGINKTADDNYSNDQIFRVGDTVYFHAKLTGGVGNEKVLLHYQITMNGEVMEENAFSESFGNNSFVWVRNTPYRHGTLMINIYYIDPLGNYNVIGSNSVQVQARTSSTQTETARGWISSCDMYFNRYGNLCFDLSSSESSDSSIIYFMRNERDNKVSQGTVTGGLVVWDSPIPGRIYEYAIWYGKQEYARDVAALGENQIPSSAWIKLYVTQNKEIVIVSSNVAINILDNQ